MRHAHFSLALGVSDASLIASSVFSSTDVTSSFSSCSARGRYTRMASTFSRPTRCRPRFHFLRDPLCAMERQVHVNRQRCSDMRPQQQVQPTVRPAGMTHRPPTHRTHGSPASLSTPRPSATAILRWVLRSIAAAHSSAREEPVTRTITCSSFRWLCTPLRPRTAAGINSRGKLALGYRAVFFQFAIESGFADAKLLGRLQLVAIEHRNGMQDRLLLQFRQRRNHRGLG